MLRIATALLLLLAGCTGLAGNDSNEATPAVPLIAVLSERDQATTFTVTVVQADGTPGARQVYQALTSNRVHTPPTSMDPACGEAPMALRVAAVDAFSGAELDQTDIPYACGPDWFVGFIDDDGTATAFAVEAIATMPPTWKRGDAWPWDQGEGNGDPANDQGDPGGEDPAPNVSFTKQASQDRLQVVSADPDADWSEIRFDVTRGGCGAVTVRTGGEQHDVDDGSTITATAASVRAGDYIQVQPAHAGCEFTLRHLPTDSLMGSWSFS